MGVGVHLDDDRCQGHGRCYALCPEVFDADDLGNAVVRDGLEWTAELLAGAERAAANCPERAITVMGPAPDGGQP